jgi:hypothetical protein
MNEMDVTYVSHGVAIGVRSNDRELLDRVAECMPPGYAASSSGAADVWYSLTAVQVDEGRRTRFELREDAEKIEEGFRLRRVLDSMDSAVRNQVGRRAPDRLFVHAGVVAWKGRGIVLPGRSGAGKTTLVAALLEAGATYLSDEYAVLDGNGMVHPYPRPLSFRQGRERRVRRTAEQLAGATASGPLPVGLIVHTTYRTGAVWQPRVLTAGEAALVLFSNTLGARERAGFAFSVAERTLAGVTTIETERADASAAAKAIIGCVDNLDP